MQLIRLLILCSCLLIPFSVNASGVLSDEIHMQQAIELAHKNPTAPFAAVIVDNNTGSVIAQGVNSVEATFNPTNHGEMVAINDCVQKHPDVNWKKVTLYTTAEPCPMCQSAIIWAGIPHVVFGTSINYLSEHKWNAFKLHAKDVNKYAHFYHGSIKGGVLSHDTNALFAKNIKATTKIHH